MSLANFFNREFDLSPLARKSKSDKDDAAELAASSELPFGVNAYYNGHTLRTLDDAKIQIIRCQGLYAEMLDDASVDIYKRQRNTALESITDSNVGIYVHEIRRETTWWPEGTYSNWFPDLLNQKLKSRLQKKPLYEHEIYISVVRYRHYSGLVGKLDRVLNAFNPTGATDKLETEARQVRDLDEKVNSVMKSLAHYAPRRLGPVQTDMGTCCEMARFLRYLVTLEDGPVLANSYNLAQAIATSYLHFGRNRILGKDVFEVKGLNHNRIGQMLAMSRWPGSASAGMADRFQKVRAEMIITQKFFPIDKLDASLAATTSEARLSHDRTTTGMSAEISELRARQVANGAVLGEHHMSVLVHVPVKGRSEDDAILALGALDEAVGRVGECIKAWQIAPVIETAGMERAVWSQVPGARKRHNGRVGKIETIHFACFASLHSFPTGRKSGNLWGECLMVLPTEGLTGYNLNFHEEAPGMVAAHLNMSAKTGRGKSMLIAIMVSQADKVKPRVHWFDRENGGTVFMQAMGGVDIVLSISSSLGNPCKMPDTPQNRAMLRELLHMMATCYGDYKLSVDDIERIALAVDDNFDDTKTNFADRRLSNLAWRLGNERTPLYRAVALWHSGGANAAVFDNEHDTLDVSKNRHYRYEMRDLMKDKDAKPELPVLLNYLTHRIEQSLDGSPSIIVWDEAQMLIRNAFWAQKIETYRETFRRRNCATIFITPEPSALYKPIAAVKNQAVTSCYMANDEADERDFIDNLHFSRSEFQFVRTAATTDYKVLIKKGSGVSVRASFDLSDSPELVAVLSSNDKSVALMNCVREELGTAEPRLWVPVFMERALAERTHNDGANKS